MERGRTAIENVTVCINRLHCSVITKTSQVDYIRAADVRLIRETLTCGYDCKRISAIENSVSTKQQFLCKTAEAALLVIDELTAYLRPINTKIRF
jgi:hypothetical protein